jgi:magnesium-transporting ATPase (P-type)
MNNLAKIEKAKKIFSALKKMWILGFVCLLIAVLNYSLLKYNEEISETGYMITLTILVGTAVFAFLWLASYIVVPVLNLVRRKIISQTSENTTISSSNMLSLYQKLTFSWRLFVLKLSSDYCFKKNRRTAYLRIQRYGERYSEEIKLISSEKSLKVPVILDGKAFYIYVKWKPEVKRDRVFASLQPEDTNGIDPKDIQTVELIKNEPVAVAYANNVVYNDGRNDEEKLEVYSVITWIGGRL